jgi:UDP-N-acetylglucosamine 4,6-dehydratase/5-epimerase
MLFKTMLNNKTILVTGATGSFGTAFIKTILKKYPKIKKLVIFSRDELKQFELQRSLNPEKINCLRYFLGDIRDKDRLMLAFRGIDIVIHAAALKQVPASEYNPFEFIKTNIIGAQNILEAALYNNVKKIVALSTDKASSPINLYGATKLCSDKLFLAAQNMFGDTNKLSITVVRYGNVMASRGSVIPFFKKQFKEKKYVTVTDKRMTRFSIFLEEGVNTVLWSIKNSRGGEIIIPKAPSMNVIDVAKVIAKDKIKYIGKRPGEKLHEELISVNESFNTIDLGYYYSILPELNYAKYFNFYKKKYEIKKFPANKSYNSLENKKFFNQEDIKKIIKNI